MSDEKAKSLEDIFENLDGIIGQMEESDVSLNESFELYKKGLEEIKAANDNLDKIEKAMKVLNTSGQLEDM